MARIIDRCEKDRPNKDWDLIREIDFADTKFLFRDIKLPFGRKIKHEIRAAYFGIFNPVYGRTATAAFRIYGYERCSKTELDYDSKPVWSTQPIRVRQLDKMYRIAHMKKNKDRLANDAEYPIALGFTSLFVRDIFQTSKHSAFLKNAKTLRIFAGFDSGDCVQIGLHSEGGIEIA